MDTAPAPATAVRLSPSRLLSQSVFANVLAIIAHYTDDHSPTMKLFSEKNQVHLFFRASLCWHRREAQFFRSGTLSAERGPGPLLPEVASRPISRLRVWGPQPLLRARRPDYGTGSRALSERRPLQRMLGDWGLWLLGGAMLSAGKRWLVHASQSHLPIHALFSVPSVLATTRARPPVRHLVALSGRSLWRTLRVQVIAEALAHPLVTWSTLALDVFPA